ncbi:helix-turn-helix domain-containing protein [Actinoplanes couchii]|uniref:PucR C-terminal helix-turn-helix domain-containing protein n=1 Tax=Actinoplanes couchii TaxID=403638 RepID=A0ABQ3XK27_9ACTN|nr:helix-turn-helix domain-containing protein [Actinoplanes couchii]MDR6320450.1 hypothetical protein [Actinoplanes couchii]GID58853.1 hypothetical protein Aco03nite_072570 [Actinoplanes couchii]
MTADGWTAMINLIERVMGDDELLPAVVSGVRATVREVSVLQPSDIAGHTRALLTAATRALAARRGPTEADLSFVEELGVTRARQGVPIEAVLAAIHVSERAIWQRAREVARAEDVDPELLLDARELYDDWADAVRSRLITAHRLTKATADPRPRDAAILRRLLQGGSAAALAVAEAGLPVHGRLWLLVARPGYDEPTQLGAVVDDLFIGVSARKPSGRVAVAAGLAGPAEPDRLAPAKRMALAALTTAESTGRTGMVHIADVAWQAALTDRADLAEALLDRHQQAWTTLGPNAEPVARAVLAWLDHDRDVTAAGTALFVHPNTVRNRVRRFTEVTGIDPSDPNAWWLCRTWLREAR